LSVVDYGFEPRSDQAKNYKIDIFGFFAKHPALILLKKVIKILYIYILTACAKNSLTN
jgi:hypothetical protein